MPCFNPVSIFSFSGCCAILVLFETVYTIWANAVCSISSFASQRSSACSTDMFSLFFWIVCYYSSSNGVLINLNTSDHFVTVIVSRWCYCQWCVLGLKHSPLCLHHLHITHAHPAWGPTAAAHQHSAQHHQACSCQWHRPANHFCHCKLITWCCTDQYVAQSCVTAAGEMHPWATWGAQFWFTHSFSLKSKNKTLTGDVGFI